LSVNVSNKGAYTLSVYNMLGQKVYSNETFISGPYNSNVNISDYGKGVYLFVLTGQGQSFEKKVVVN
jgi:hypothetical protein